MLFPWSWMTRHQTECVSSWKRERAIQQGYALPSSEGKVLSLAYLCKKPYLCKKLIYHSQFWVKCLKKKMVCLYILNELSYVVSSADDGDGSPQENWELIFDEIHQKWWSVNLAGHHFCKGGDLRFSTRQPRGFLYRSPICLKIFKWRIHVHGSVNPTKFAEIRGETLTHNAHQKYFAKVG
jgi:hypothetical protein